MSGRALRAFFAVELPRELREQIAERTHELAKILPAGVRWTPAEQYHVTLKFLGDVAEDRVPELVQRAAGVLARVASFDAELGGFGAFPSAARANIAWIGIGHGSAQLARLARKLDAPAQRIGVERERRPFHAHITVGRLREPQAIPFAQFTRPSGGPTFRVEEVVLFESRLSPAGSTYLPYERLPLAEQGDEPYESDEYSPEDEFAPEP